MSDVALEAGGHVTSDVLRSSDRLTASEVHTMGFEDADVLYFSAQI